MILSSFAGQRAVVEIRDSDGATAVRLHFCRDFDATRPDVCLDRESLEELRTALDRVAGFVDGELSCCELRERMGGPPPSPTGDRQISARDT